MIYENPTGFVWEKRDAELKRSCHPSACQAALPALTAARPGAAAVCCSAGSPAPQQAPARATSRPWGARARSHHGPSPTEPPVPVGAVCGCERPQQVSGAGCWCRPRGRSAEGAGSPTAPAERCRADPGRLRAARGRRAVAAICLSPRLQQALCHLLYLSPSPDVASDRC